MDGILALIILFATIIGLPALGFYLIRNNSERRLKNKKGTATLCVFGDKKLGVKLDMVAATGFILTYNLYSFNKPVCPEHAAETYRQYQIHNLFKAWWSLRGLFRTPFLLAQNHSQYGEYKKALKEVLLG